MGVWQKISKSQMKWRESSLVGVVVMALAVTLVSPASAVTTSLKVNAGGGAVDSWQADAFFSGGAQAKPRTEVVDTSKVANAAPQAVYQTERYGIQGTNFSYTLNDLTPSARYKLRLHFNEFYFDQAGKRVFNVLANGNSILQNFDVYQAAGSKNIAVAREFDLKSNADGVIKLEFNKVVENPKISGIELEKTILPVSPAKIASGNTPATPDWAADTAYVGGTAARPRTDAVDTAGVTNPAPQAIYQNERYGKFQYNLVTPKPNTEYIVRLHFNEFYFTEAGKRVFAVDNGSTRLLDNFDVYSAAGAKNKAVVREFTLKSDADGVINLAFVPIVENPKVSGVEYVEKPTDPGYLNGWGAPTWRDEFSGTAVDTTKWQVLNNTYLSYDWAWITAANASVDNTTGTLKLKVEPMATTKTTCSKRDAVTKACTEYRDRKWTSAYLKSTMTAQYGRWEIRAKIPTYKNVSTGVWPAFWHRAIGGTGEIDTMEAWGTATTTRTAPTWWPETSVFTVHKDTNCSSNCLNPSWNIDRTLNPLASSYNTASSGFHTWAMERTPTSITSYFDGKKVAELTPTSHPWAFAAGSFQNLALDTRLNIQMGDAYWSRDPQLTDILQMPAVFEVDHFRYWPLPQ